jgi:hypothetical protein
MPKPGIVRVRPAATPVGDAAAPHFAPIRPNSGWVPLTKSGRRFETKFLARQVGLEQIIRLLTAEPKIPAFESVGYQVGGSEMAAGVATDTPSI